MFWEAKPKTIHSFELQIWIEQSLNPNLSSDSKGKLRVVCLESFHGCIFSDTVNNITSSRLMVTPLRENSVYILFYINLARIPITGLLPFLALCILNYLVYVHLVRRRKNILNIGKCYQVRIPFHTSTYIYINNSYEHSGVSSNIIGKYRISLWARYHKSRQRYLWKLLEHASFKNFLVINRKPTNVKLAHGNMTSSIFDFFITCWALPTIWYEFWTKYWNLLRKRQIHSGRKTLSCTLHLILEKYFPQLNSDSWVLLSNVCLKDEDKLTLFLNLTLLPKEYNFFCLYDTKISTYRNKTRKSIGVAKWRFPLKFQLIVAITSPNSMLSIGKLKLCLVWRWSFSLVIFCEWLLISTSSWPCNQL